jgi:ABC-type nickel/cobalt efflux system permease component RcnA
MNAMVGMTLVVVHMLVYGLFIYLAIRKLWSKVHGKIGLCSKVRNIKEAKKKKSHGIDHDHELDRDHIRVNHHRNEFGLIPIHEEEHHYHHHSSNNDSPIPPLSSVPPPSSLSSSSHSVGSTHVTIHDNHHLH